MKQSTIKKWDRNLEYFVTKLKQDNYTKQEIQRHCRDFLKSYREVIAENIV